MMFCSGEEQCEGEEEEEEEKAGEKKRRIWLESELCAFSLNPRYEMRFI